MFVDIKVQDADQNWQLVSGSRSGFPMNPGQKRRVDPVDLVLHAIDDGLSWTRKLREHEGYQVA
jgi:hypothetical protein